MRLGENTIFVLGDVRADYMPATAADAFWEMENETF